MSTDKNLTNLFDKDAENLTDKLNNMSINHSNILYYELKFSKENYSKILQFVLDNTKNDGLLSLNNCPDNFAKILKTSKETDKIIISGDSAYKINDEFHITVLFTGGKQDDKGIELCKFLNNKYDIIIEKIGMTDDFISVGVIIKGDLPYYGNNVKHITIGLNKFGKSKKVFPKDSYTALLSDNIVIPDKPLCIESEFVYHTK